MFVKLSEYMRLVNEFKHEFAQLNHRLGESRARGLSLEIELERARNDIKWFMHRLTQVEQERAAMFFQATGTRIATPQFKSAEQEAVEQRAASDVLNALGAPFAGVGEDSTDPADQLPEQRDGTEDYSHLPGFKRQ